MENEAITLRDLVDKLYEELEETRRELVSRNADFSQAQEKCKSYANQLDIICQDVCILCNNCITKN